MPLTKAQEKVVAEIAAGVPIFPQALHHTPDDDAGGKEAGA